MRHAVVIGAGLGGLGSALFLARRGWRVTVLERDEEAPPPMDEPRLGAWSRRGVSHMRQPHHVVGRALRILAAEAPDVLVDLEAAGAPVLSPDGRRADPGGARPAVLCARRPLLEAALAAAAERRTGVRVLRGAEAVDLTVRPAEPPQVTGVVLADGGRLDADLVVDAAGRFARLARRLAGARIAPETEEPAPLDVAYLTQWLRLAPGARRPSPRPLQRAHLGWGELRMWRADGDMVALSLAVSRRDPLIPALRRPEAFADLMRASPLARPWMALARPAGEPLFLARVENRRFTLAPEGRPLAAGLALVGDAALHANPTLGHGAAYALSMALRLAELAEVEDVRRPEFLERFEAWRRAALDPFFDLQVARDERLAAEIRGCLAGEPRRPPDDPRLRFWAALTSLASESAAAARVLEEARGMTRGPGEVESDPAVRRLVEARLAARPLRAPPPAAPSRAVASAIAGLHAPGRGRRALAAAE